jgi:hypothetical protein
MIRVVGFAIVLAAACGGAQSTGPAVMDGPLAPGAWDRLNRAERRDVMRKLVFPRMSMLFQEYDAAKYARMSCVTCHGKGVAADTFGMPNPDLAALASDLPGSVAADKQAIDAFMRDKLTPAMATTLGVPLATAENPEGFGCFTCHLRKQ